ncbi:MAG: DUF6600 domain-containing protein [Chthoniobacterales bacterium]
MKIFRFFSIAASLTLLASCQKQQTEAERNAEVERQVQDRLASERQATEQQRLAQQAADLDAREKALADNESTAKKPAIANVSSREEQQEQTVASSERDAPRGYDTFYRKLEPYGAWRETGDYGYVWQPREAQRSRNWRPYTNGRWAYTDAGWTWVSDEPFGWATYHYGRWTRLSEIGWVWVPGDEWAPAWVSWREGGDHVGWAPLPPEAHFEKGTGIHQWADSYYDIDADEYVFIPNEEIGAENVQQYALPPERNVAIVTQTTNVTNITYNKTFVVNEGPNYEQLRGHSHRPLPRMRLEREYNVRDNEPPRARIVGDTLALVAPLFTAHATERPHTEGAAITQTQVERNWASRGNQAEAQRAREKMRAEATPPSNAPAKRYDKPVVTGTAPAATATPAAAATATAAPVTRAETSATVAPSPAASPSATFSRRPLTTPSATPSATATATPAATATATPSPRATPTATPAAIATPVATPSTTPLATRAPLPIPTTRPVATPEASVPATSTPLPNTEGSPVMRNVPGQDPRQLREEARKQQEEIRRRSLDPNARRGGVQPQNAPPIPTHGMTPVATPNPAQTPAQLDNPTAQQPSPQQSASAATPQSGSTPNETATATVPPRGGRGHPRGGLRAPGPDESPSPAVTPKNANQP